MPVYLYMRFTEKRLELQRRDHHGLRRYALLAFVHFEQPSELARNFTGMLYSYVGLLIGRPLRIHRPFLACQVVISLPTPSSWYVPRY